MARGPSRVACKTGKEINQVGGRVGKIDGTAACVRACDRGQELRLSPFSVSSNPHTSHTHQPIKAILARETDAEGLLDLILQDEGPCLCVDDFDAINCATFINRCVCVFMRVCVCI